MNGANVVNRLGAILFEMGEFKKSKDYYERLKQRLLKNDVNVLFGLGRAHGGLSEFREGLTYFIEAHNICSNANPPDLIHAAKVATYADNAHRFLCEYNKALAYYNEALNTYERTDMTDTLDMVKTLTGVGWLYSYLGKDIHSLQYFEQALNIVQKVVPFKDHPDFSDAHMNVAQALCRHGDYNRSVMHIEICVDIERRILPNTSYQFAITLLNMSKFLYKQGSHDRALTINSEAINVLKLHRNGKNLIQDAFACNDLGKIYYRPAKEHYEKALACLKVLIPNVHIDMAYTLKNMSEVYLAYGDLERAASYINTTLEMYGRLLTDSEHRDKAKALHQLVQVLITCQDDEHALIILRRTPHMWKLTLVALHPDVALCMKDIARLHRRRIKRFVLKEKLIYKLN